MRPKYSTGYFTPQPNKKKSLSKRSGSSENLFNLADISDDVLKKFMVCPIKKQLIIDLITSEKDKIDAYKKELEKENGISAFSPLQKRLKRPCESPSALLRRRLEQQRNCSENRDKNSDSGSSSGSRPGSRQSASTVPSPVNFDEILKGIIAFVEVKSGGRDRSDGVKIVLKNMGAKVRDKFTKDISHVIFKDGSFSTYQKANLIKAKLVSVLWLEACKSSGIRVPEKEYSAFGSIGVDQNQTILCSQMQKDYEEIIREEFNKSIALGEPLPSVKSLIDRRRTLMTPIISSSFTQKADVEDSEVANIMRRTIHGNLTPESAFDDESDTGAIIDGDTTDNLFENFNQNQAYHTTSTIPENMDLTNLRGEALIICSDENDLTNISANLYDKKTPKICQKNRNNSNDSPNLLDNDLYKRRTDIFESSPIFMSENDPKCKLTQKNIEHKKTPQLINTNMEKSNLEIPEKSSSTAMSILQISDDSNKNINTSSRISKENNSRSTNSFSPLQPNVINTILEKLNEAVPTEPSTITQREKNILINSKKKRTTRSSLKRKNDSKDATLGLNELGNSMEDLVLETPQINIKKTENITMRKKYLNKENTNLLDDDQTKNSPTKTFKSLQKKVINFSSTSDDESSCENVNKDRIVSTRTRRKTFGNKSDDKKKDYEEQNYKRKTITVKNNNKETEINLEHQTKNRRNTHKRKSIAGTLEIKEGELSPQKIPKMSPPKINLRSKTNNKLNNVQVNSTSKITKDLENSKDVDNPMESRKLHNKRNTIGSYNKNKEDVENVSSKALRRTLSNKDLRVTEKCSIPEKKTRKLRKLYDPTSSSQLINSDEQEREDRRQARRRSVSGIFIKPTIILSQKAKEFTEMNKLNIDDILDPSSDESPKESKNKKDKSTKKGNEKIVNSDDDEQIELIDWISKKTNKVQDETNSQVKNKKDEIGEISMSSTSNKEHGTRSKTPITPKTPRNVTKPKVKLTPITPIRNRRSTMEFQPISLSNIKKKLKIDEVKIPSIVCTKMHREDVIVFGQIVKKLGRFNVEDEVSQKTTHLVAGEPKRTINMLRAIAMGCWILKKEWLFRSLEEGKWLPEEDFEEIDFSPSVQQIRLQRQAFGPFYSMDVFQNCGIIYISRSSTPRCSDLQELVALCKGKVTKNPRRATIIVGEYAKYEGTVCVAETWVLDCISLNQCLTFKKYRITSDRRSVLV